MTRRPMGWECGAEVAILCIPTTRLNLATAAHMARRREAIVVCDRARFPVRARSLTPLEMLVAFPPGRPPDVPIVSFTDQFVDPVNAPIPMGSPGSRTYFSSIEPVCSSRFGLPIRLLLDGLWSRAHVVRDQQTFEHALRLMTAYFSACEALGGAWLARPIQGERSEPQRRRTEAALKRLYASVLMVSAIDEGLTPTLARLIDDFHAAARGPGSDDPASGLAA